MKKYKIFFKYFLILIYFINLNLFQCFSENITNDKVSNAIDTNQKNKENISKNELTYDINIDEHKDDDDTESNLIEFNNFTQNPIGISKKPLDHGYIEPMENNLINNQTIVNPFNKLIKNILKLYGKNPMNSKISFLSIESELIKGYMNLSVDPCDDFYEYACGNWHLYNPIPPDFAEYHILGILNTRITNILKTEFSREKTNDELEAKAKIFYKTCVDTDHINERSIEPLKKFIEYIGGWPAIDKKWSEDKFDLIDLLVKTQKFGFESILFTSAELNVHNTENHIIQLDGAKLGIKDSVDYIFEDDFPRYKAYKTLISEVLDMLNVEKENIESIATEILNFEGKLFKNRFLKAMNSFFNEPISVEKLIQDYSDFDWIRFFSSVFNQKINSNQTVILNGMPDVNKFMNFLMNTDKKVLTNYIVWKSVYSLLPALDERFIEARQVFLEVLLGQPKIPPRWKICSFVANKHFELLTTSFIVNAIGLNENVIEDVRNIMEELQQEFSQTLSNADWMDNETKNSAKLKINNTIFSVGYPIDILNRDTIIKHYKQIQMEDGKYFENYLKLLEFTRIKELNHLGKPSDFKEWPSSVSPSVANAYFLPTQNRIFIPSGIIQTPVYHKDYPKALKYGSLGSIIGHEMTHGFDSSGRLFDFKGNFKTWWSENSTSMFQKKSKCFVRQYRKFSINKLKLNGRSSLTENIADNGGIRESFSIYKNWLKAATPEELENERLPNLDIKNEQLFFLGFAQTWCSIYSPQALEHKFSTDPHPTGKFRTLGTLQNSEDFSRVFNCQLGSVMNPEKKCILW